MAKAFYVLLGYHTTRHAEVSFSHQGDLVTYEYPIASLEDTKNKTYSGNGASVYR